jgi:hypothetical protein
MSNVPSIQPPQHFLELIKRIYEKRDQVLESSNRLLEIADEIDACDKGDLKPLLTKAEKEINVIISNIHELSPHLQNPSIAEGISRQAKLLIVQIEKAGRAKVLHKAVAFMIKVGICQDANKTKLRLTPKSIKQAFGITVSPRDIKLLYEHHQDNY